MIEYRLADDNDSDRLAELRWQHKAEEESLDLSQKDDFIELCSASLKTRFKEDLYCWVAVENRIIISNIYIVVVKKVPKPEKINGLWGYITAVYNMPEYRNKGICSALMGYVKEWSRIKKLELLIVWPSERSISFYERSGFNDINDVMELSLE